jgi:hypothetical protein
MMQLLERHVGLDAHVNLSHGALADGIEHSTRLPAWDREAFSLRRRIHGEAGR